MNVAWSVYDILHQKITFDNPVFNFSMTIQFQFCSQIDNVKHLLVIGRKVHLLQESIPKKLGIPLHTWRAMLKTLTSTERPLSTKIWVEDREIVIGVIPEKHSRYNCPAQPWAITRICEANLQTGDWGIVLYTSSAHLSASAIAIAKGFQAYSCASTAKNRTIFLQIRYSNQLCEDQKILDLMDGIQLAASLVDRPTNQLNVSDFITEAQAIAKMDKKIRITIIQGKELKQRGLGGIWNVGKAAQESPALVCLQWLPQGSRKHLAWVGKGIVYDTGGLSLKTKIGMPSMKSDMGGAAAVLGAFRVAVAHQVQYSISAVLCLADNAIGPDSTRPDDVITLFSGKTVEVNNTDAEGRLVLADGVAWVARTHSVSTIVDIGTLTGAAPAAVGKRLAAVYCNHDALEKKAQVAGQTCGELCHPLPYLPEFFRDEFSSTIADMKNSAKDKRNGHSAAAGQFIANHLPTEDIPWLHLDISGPAWKQGQRGSGFGVALLLKLGDLL